MQPGIAAAHILEDQRQVSSASINAGRHNNHSHPGEPKTSILSKLKMQQGMVATHRLE